MKTDRMTRLLADAKRLDQLRELNSGCIDFVSDKYVVYRVALRCRGLRLRELKKVPTDAHEVDIFLGPEYPDRAPDLQWRTPIFHPNIKPPNVCAGLVEHWDSDTTLDTVVVWLWDMARYHLYTLGNELDTNAARWVSAQPRGLFPTDSRTLNFLSALVVRQPACLK